MYVINSKKKFIFILIISVEIIFGGHSLIAQANSQIINSVKDLFHLDDQKSSPQVDLANRIATVIVIGGGVAGSEAGTFLGQYSTIPLKVIEIESEDSRKFGGWGFQSFPATETTNLAMRKMYLGEDPADILRWTEDLKERKVWPTNFKDLSLSPDRPLPRSLIQQYVHWRRKVVNNQLVSFESITGEAIKISANDDRTINVLLNDGHVINGDRLVIASGSI